MTAFFISSRDETFDGETLRKSQVKALIYSSAQSNNSAGLDFDPKIDGFSFANYRNVGNWQDDLGADDLIKLFGLKTACKTGTNASNCVLHVAAEKWKNEILEAMNIGHCEGIAVASLRIKTEQAFKKRTFPEQFQPGTKTTFSLSRNQLIENYKQVLTQGSEW